jgi:hypothetical protein
MAQENSMKEKMTQTTSRQKVIIAVMVIVVLIIAWQIIGLMGNGSTSAPPAIQAVVKMDAAKPSNKSSNMTNQSNIALSNTQKPSPEPLADDSLRQGSIVNDPQFNRLQRITEEKYVGKLNELEELRIQRQIAETNQAITAAKLATITAEKDIGDLLTKPSSPGVSYSSQSVRTSVDLGPMGAESVQTPAAPPPPQELAPYKLMSVSMLLNKWTAIVSLLDTMFSVGIGDTLPPDGSVVTGITKNSMTLKKEGKYRKVSITSSF